jgi:ketopantoate reductase
VGAETLILPLLNGMQHLDVLAARCGRNRVLGGQRAATPDKDYAVVHLNDSHELSFGENRTLCALQLAANLPSGALAELIKTAVCAAVGSPSRSASLLSTIP